MPFQALDRAVAKRSVPARFTVSPTSLAEVMPNGFKVFS